MQRRCEPRTAVRLAIVLDGSVYWGEQCGNKPSNGETNMKKKIADKSFTLADADILSQRRISRRSLLSALGVGLGSAAAAVVARPSVTAAQSGCTDNDLGRFEDPPGLGRRCRPRSGAPTGCTDTDRGPNEDPANFGMRCWV